MWRQNVQSIQCDAAHIPLEDESVDLIVTSPPYFALRDYRENGGSLEGQIGQEPSPAEFLESLWACTEEWMRVLKPTGSIFVNLGDKWAGGGGQWKHPSNTNLNGGRGAISNGGATYGHRSKSLLGLPWRYAIGCTDRLGLILREEVIWSKPNGMPESARDRCRRSHEQLFHFTKNERYYSAVDRIRIEQTGGGKKGRTWAERKELGEPGRYGDTGTGASGGMEGGLAGHPLGKLPPSVWEIPTAPLVVPSYLAEESLDGSSFDFDHYAAFPPALPATVIDGWCPAGVCTRCGQGRFPVSVTVQESTGRVNSGDAHTVSRTQVIGNACACTPYTDHPERRGKDWRGTDSGDRGVTGQRMGKDFQGNGHPSRSGGEWKADGGAARVRERREPGREGQQTEFAQDEWGRGQPREYHLDAWDPPPVVPGVVLDPFGGTGTTAITAAKMGRRGISCDLSSDCAGPLIQWRMHDLSQNKRR